MATLENVRTTLPPYFAYLISNRSPQPANTHLPELCSISVSIPRTCMLNLKSLPLFSHTYLHNHGNQISQAATLGPVPFEDGTFRATWHPFLGTFATFINATPITWHTIHIYSMAHRVSRIFSQLVPDRPLSPQATRSLTHTEHRAHHPYACQIPENVRLVKVQPQPVYFGIVRMRNVLILEPIPMHLHSCAFSSPR